MKHAPPMAIGIDVGGTKILGALVDTSTGEVVATRRLPTIASDGGQAVLDRCVTLAEQLSRSVPGTPSSTPVGISLCEMVDREGRPSSAATIDWLGLDIAGPFAEIGPVAVESDVRAAAIAEARFGTASVAGQFVYVSVGTGIAFTLMLAGEPHRGTHGAAILLGVPPVERVASGPAIAWRSRQPTAEAAFTDPGAAAVIADAAAQLGNALAWLNNALDPELIVVGGGLGVRVDYLAAVVEAMNAAVVDAGGVAAHVRPASLGEASAAVGAALVAADADVDAHF